MADKDTQVKEEYNDSDLGSMMNDLYPVEGQESTPAPEPEPEPQPVKEEIVEETLKKEDVHVPSKELPPGFNPSAKNDNQDVVEDIEITDEAMDEAIENAPNDNYKQNIVNMRKSLQTNKETIKELREQLDNKSNNSSEEIEKKLSEAYDKLGKFDLMQDPRFVDKFSRPMKTQLENIKRIVSPLIESMPEDERPKDLNQLVLNLGNADPVQRINWLKDNVPEEYRAAIIPYYTRVDEIVAERNHALKNHQSELAELKKQSVTQEEAKTEAYRKAIKAKTTTDVVQDGFSIFERKEGNAEYNEFVDTLHRNVDEIFVSNDTEVQAKAMLLGVAAPIYRNMYETTEAKLQEALTEIESLKGSKPKFKGESGSNTKNTSSEPKSSKSIAQMLSNEMDLQR